MPRLRIRPLVAAVPILFVLTSVACSAPVPNVFAPTTSGGSAVAADQVAKGAAAARPAPAATSAAASPDGTARQAVSDNASAPLEVQAQAAQPPDRMIIRTGQLAIEVTDIEGALAQVRLITQQGGGFVSASNTHVEKVNDQDRTVADLTIQVRSESADSTMSALRALGKVTSESSGSQDVTEEYVDLDSNLRNLQASEAAILKLMDKATQIQDIVSLQRELTNVRGQIERIQGRKRYLERRSDMATISVSLRLPAVEGQRPLIGGAWDPGAVAQRGWQASLAVLRGAAELIIIVVAFSWWLVPLVGLGAWFLLQRRRPRPAAPAEG
jgi:hypothetical protein